MPSTDKVKVLIQIGTTGSTPKFVDVTDDLDPDAGPVALSWGRRDELADPDSTQLTISFYSPLGKYIPGSTTFPQWGRGSQVMLATQAGVEIWTGYASKITPSWGGGDTAGWSRVTVTVVAEEIALPGPKLGSLFEETLRGGVNGNQPSEYWRLSADTENLINPANPLTLGPEIKQYPAGYYGSFAFGQGGPAGDQSGAAAGYNDADDKTGGWYTIGSKPVARPEFILAWVTYKPKLVRNNPTSKQYNAGIMSVHTSSWTSMLSVIDPGYLRLYILSDRNAGTGTSWAGASYDTTFALSPGVPYIIGWAPRTMQIYALNTITGDVGYWGADQNTPGYSTITWPSDTVTHNLTIGAINFSGASQEDPTRYAFGGTICRVALWSRQGTFLGLIRKLKAYANREGILFSELATIAGINKARWLIAPPGAAESSTNQHGNLAWTDGTVWSDTAGKTRYELAKELVLRTEGGQMCVFRKGTFWARSALRPYGAFTTLDALSDLEGPPEYSFDFVDQVSQVTIKSSRGESKFIAPSQVANGAFSGEVTIETALLDIERIRILAEDRLSRVRDQKISLTEIKIDLQTASGAGRPDYWLNENRVGPASRIRIYNVPSSLFGAEFVDVLVTGGRFEATTESSMLTLYLTPADSPPAFIVDVTGSGMLDTHCVAY